MVRDGDRVRVVLGFARTYEGLKLVTLVGSAETRCGFARTYEGLKRDGFCLERSPDPAFCPYL